MTRPVDPLSEEDAVALYRQTIATRRPRTTVDPLDEIRALRPKYLAAISKKPRKKFVPPTPTTPPASPAT